MRVACCEAEWILNGDVNYWGFRGILKGVCGGSKKFMRFGEFWNVVMAECDLLAGND